MVTPCTRIEYTRSAPVRPFVAVVDQSGLKSGGSWVRVSKLGVVSRKSSTDGGTYSTEWSVSSPMFLIYKKTAATSGQTSVLVAKMLLDQSAEVYKYVI